MFIFPMAGLSSRFSKAGFSKPKFALQAGNMSLFEHSLYGFREYFAKEVFLFIYLKNSIDPAFIIEKTNNLGLPQQNIKIIALEQPTDGQATTVAQGLLQCGVHTDEPISIFNIDTIYISHVKPKALIEQRIDGYLDVFEGIGNHWSFVKPADPRKKFGSAIQVTEKHRISNLCCSGLYYFKSARLFLEAFKNIQNIPASNLPGQERYIAPLYNSLITQNSNIYYNKIPLTDISFAGTPDEYQLFCAQNNWQAEQPSLL
jgi:hypothetical protein